MRVRAAALMWMVAACGINPAFDEAATVAATVVDPTTDALPLPVTSTSGSAETSSSGEGLDASGDGSTSTTTSGVATSTTSTETTSTDASTDATTGAPAMGDCPEDDALIACYRFEEGPGDGPMLDGSGNGHHGTRATAGSVASVDGFGSAIDLSTFSDVHVTDDEAFTPEQLTLATFVYAQPGQDKKGLIDRLGSYRLFIADDSVHCRLQTSFGQIEYAVAIGTGRWYHVACTFGGGQLRMHVHGEGAQPMDVAIVVAGELLGPNGSEFVIGRNADEDATRLTGWMDQVLVFGRPLASDEVCALAGPLCPS